MNKSFEHNLLITGGAGFIGSTLVREALKHNSKVTILDALTYAGHLASIEEVLKPGTCELVKGSINDSALLKELFKEHSFSGVIHLAAESHVDNSIDGPLPFITTNIEGTYQLLEAARGYWKNLEGVAKDRFRFLHVSTDEVFGELGPTGKFNEQTPYHPNSPYSASKAASDHLVRAWHHTYKLPTIVTNCSNNYGPRQFPEKLIPLMIQQALSHKPLPVYGKGENVRDWIHVEDHALGLWLAFTGGKIGQTYCFGGNCERKNIDIVNTICRELDQIKPRSDGKSYKEQISFVTDRLGHDWRYAIDDRLAENELGFKRRYQNFESGLKATIDWYLTHDQWVKAVLQNRSKSVS